MVWGGCQLHDSSSFRFAQTKKTPLIFKKGSDTASYTFKVSNGTLSVPSSVQKLDSIKWYYSKVKDEKADSGKLTDESFCKIYVVLREPIKTGGSYPPRKDVLDIACEVAKGKKDDDSIRDAMTGGLWGYLDGNGYQYSGRQTNCTALNDPEIREYNDIFRRNLSFKLSNALYTKYLDCKDTSSLAQICCNSVGIDEQVIVTSTRQPWQDCFMTNHIRGFGLSLFISEAFTHHQINVHSPGNILYDPTCRLLPPNDFAKQVKSRKYLELLVHPSYITIMIWFNKRKVVEIN